jgi:hypothetical protein
MRATNVEKRIAGEIASSRGLGIAKLGLRFDRVFVRLLGDLRTFAESALPGELIVLISITAPIRQPDKTAAVLKRKIELLLAASIFGRDQKMTVHQNEVRMRLVNSATKQAPKLIGFVHNPDTSSKLLLDLAGEWLLSTLRLSLQ